MESRAFLKNVLERMQVSSTAMVGHKKCMLLLFLKFYFSVIANLLG